jgi:hypothetical protein
MASNYQKQLRNFSAAEGARRLRDVRHSQGRPLFNLNADVAAMELVKVPPSQTRTHRDARRLGSKELAGKRAGKVGARKLKFSK